MTDGADAAFCAKTLLDRAGLRGVNAILAGLTAEPAALLSAVGQAEARLG